MWGECTGDSSYKTSLGVTQRHTNTHRDRRIRVETEKIFRSCESMKQTRPKKAQKGIVRKRGQMDTVTQTVICRGDTGYLRLVRSLLQPGNVRQVTARLGGEDRQNIC